ncbi:MAG TPA: SPOR domain-containing protein [Saprospiraceae bacterium]|nr:SPOR domain-containing protein [Saprospiraceae bacterium]
MDVPGSRIKPPYIQPAFNEKETDEDALLATYIHYTNGADPAEIDQAIASFVQRVKDHVERNDHYVIDQFGSFSKSSTGGLRFTPDWDAFNLSFSGMEVIDLHPAVEPVKISPPVVEPYIPIEPIITPEGIAPIKEEIHSVPDRPEIVPVETRHEVIIDETTSRLWWTILATALVLITVLCVYLAWDIFSNRQKLADKVVTKPDTTVQVNPTPIPPEAIDTSITQQTPEVTKDTEPVEETAPKPVPETPKAQATQTPDKSYCYIIVGAFKDASNVSNMENRLISLGYEVEKIAGGTLTRVAIKSSCDKTILQQTLNDARSKVNPEAWIY